MRSTLLALLLCAATVAGQTTQSADLNEVRLNGVGAGGTSCLFVGNMNDSDALDMEIDAVGGAPFIMATDVRCQPGTAFISTGYTLDLSFTAPVFLLDGSGALGGNGPLTPFINTGATGDVRIVLPLNGSEFATQFGFLSPVFPTGLGVSAAFNVSFGGLAGAVCLGLDPSFSRNVLTMGDDTSVNLSTPFFRFYGTFYANVNINSNGNITFGASRTDFSESVIEFLSGPPSIAMWWDDLNPGAGGSVIAGHNSIGVAYVCFERVPEFGTTNSNSFRMFYTNTDFQVSYGAMASFDGLIGMTPGNNVDPVGTAIDFTSIPVDSTFGLTGGLTAYYEIFTPSAPRDFGYGFTWSVGYDGSGRPIVLSR